MKSNIQLHPHQFWIQPPFNLHANCGTAVYGDDQGNRYCVDNECMGSHHDFGIEPMTDLISQEQWNKTFKFSKTKLLDLEELEKQGIVENVKSL